MEPGVDVLEMKPHGVETDRQFVGDLLTDVAWAAMKQTLGLGTPPLRILWFTARSGRDKRCSWMKPETEPRALPRCPGPADR